MITKLRSDDPAFPAKIPLRDTRGQEASDFMFFGGITLRDWFATHAPEVPGWFRTDLVSKTRYGGLPPCPLPRNDHENNMLAERFIAWRWHYADLMVAARGGA